jgi:hypothetical protein
MNDEGMIEKRKDFITENQKQTELKSTENNSRLARSSIAINLWLGSKRSSLEPHSRLGRRLRLRPQANRAFRFRFCSPTLAGGGTLAGTMLMHRFPGPGRLHALKSP